MSYHNHQTKEEFPTVEDLIAGRKVVRVDTKEHSKNYILEDGTRIYDYANQRGYEIPPIDSKIKDLAVELILTKTPAEDLAELYSMYKADREGWVFKNRGHFGWSMGLRNLLRSGELTDDLLPSGNWDDYYIPVLEEALEAWVALPSKD